MCNEIYPQQRGKALNRDFVSFSESEGGANPNSIKFDFRSDKEYSSNIFICNDLREHTNSLEHARTKSTRTLRESTPCAGKLAARARETSALSKHHSHEHSRAISPKLASGERHKTDRKQV